MPHHVSRVPLNMYLSLIYFAVIKPFNSESLQGNSETHMSKPGNAVYQRNLEPESCHIMSVNVLSRVQQKHVFHDICGCHNKRRVGGASPILLLV